MSERNYNFSFYILGMASSKPNVWASLFESDSDDDDEYVERGNRREICLLICFSVLYTNCICRKNVNQIR